MDVRADDANDGRWMTHAELAASRGISTASAIKLALRHHWRKQKDNRGTVRCLVPPEWSTPKRDKGADARADVGADEIAQLASNLLGNAITYGTPDKPIRVRATTTGGIFELSVANGGEPIPPAAMEHLFRPFFRGIVRPSQEGLGLGLYIASKIARAHGGDIVVSSAQAETRFTFSMPIGTA